MLPFVLNKTNHSSDSFVNFSFMFFFTDVKHKLCWQIAKKINSGKLYELAEVVRDLNKKTDIIAEQSYSERQLFEKAYNRLKSELEVVLGEKAQQKMDKALKFKENSLQKETLL